MTPKTMRMIRLAYGMTQNEFADRLNCSQQLIAMIERGERRLSKRMRGRLEVVFDLDADKIETIQRLKGMFEDGESNC
ncbi:helix-turn-helix domain-containing protein [Bacillus mojavensis]|uniref:helix-turn-helix domain-containing protein n=1 Tax=Bacillus mojavensis TaxID=72360 RepID=UPI002DBFBC9C|nr:helix-turn-helix transcriptional regulator [Bacillus mojavensis]MEC1670592.1 helix-turn-helix transcriptional regulator [Bacillus mojavensis]